MIELYGILYLLAAYLLGSLPNGYLLTKKATGKDIRSMGSGNIGSTNARRVAGKRISVYTQLLDMLKGLFLVGLLMLVDSFYTNIAFSPFYIYLVAIAAILGHDFSLFLKFQGGKGVNTTLGASILLAPYAVLISVAVYFITKKAFQYVSLGSLALAISLPLTELILSGLSPGFYYLCFCAFLIIILHRKNILRLFQGTEPKSNG